MTDRRVVVTGLGSVCPGGMTTGETWESLLRGECSISLISAFDPSGFSCQLAGEVGKYKIRNFVPKSYRKAIKLMSRDIELSIMAAAEALADAGIKTKAFDADEVTIEPERTAVTFGAGLISCDLEELAPSVAVSITDHQFDQGKWGTAGLEALTPIWLLKYLPNMLACHVGIIHDIRGPSNTITCGEAGGHLAIAEAMDVIVRGNVETALAGGCEAKVNPIVMLRQCLLGRATSERNDDPSGACRPFASDAGGSVFGEGAGVVVLEEMDHAVSRGAKIYAEVAGTGSSNSLNAKYEHVEADGRGIEIAIRKALAEAKIEPGDIDLIIPHGTGIVCDDAAEAKALENVFGDSLDKILVWPTKSMLSHTGTASGALDLIVAAKAISEGEIGAARNCSGKADGCDKLNLSTKRQAMDVKYALTCSYTFGGQTAAVVLKKIGGNA